MVFVKNTINACAAHVELLPMMKSMTLITMNFISWWLSYIVLGQWIQCLGHGDWVCTKSNLGG
jgi:hypothetical protein